MVELGEYIRKSKRVLSEDESRDSINYLAAHPKADIRMRGTGDIRKIRWKREGSGKQGAFGWFTIFTVSASPLFAHYLWQK